MRPYPVNWNEIIARVKERDNYTCRKCNKRFTSFELRVHHMIPLSKGGSNNDTNLQTLCDNCHNSKHFHLKNKSKLTSINKYSRKFSDSDFRI